MSTRGVQREPLWTQSECEFLRDNYVRMPIAAIAAELGRNYESVRRKAAKVGVQRQAWGESFTDREDELLLERYSTSAMREMTALLGRHHNSIRQRARALGLTNGEQAKRAAMAAGVRHDYFRRIDSPIKAYVLGLLATDGCVSLAGNGVHLKVARKDAELAELVRDEISPQSVVRISAYPPLPGYTKEREAAQFSVASAQMKADLARLGVVPRKTLTLQWPNLEPQFAAPFILGCFDGDGCLTLRGQPSQWRWLLYSASAQFLVPAQDAIRQRTGLDLLRSTSKRGLHELRLNGVRRIQILDEWLHTDVPGLSRKRLTTQAA